MLYNLIMLPSWNKVIIIIIIIIIIIKDVEWDHFWCWWVDR